MEKIGIIGMGRVGLTLALTLASAGFKVLGVEREEKIVQSLNKGKPHFYEKGLETLLKKHLENNDLRIVTKIEEAQEAYIICVGTPIDKTTKRVIIQPLIRATEEVARWVKNEDLIVLRSTVPVGTTRNIVLPILERTQKSFYLAYCPERTIEGKALLELRELPQIIGGLDERSVDKAASIFSKITPTIVRMESLEAAELVKLIDNAYRDLNFAFANEIALLAGRFGVDGYKLIKAANYGYPRNNIPIPGFVGGACLSKDPYILIESTLEKGYKCRLPLISRRINEEIIARVANKIKEDLASFGKDTKQAKVFILGIAFKGEPETDDIRDSPAVELAKILEKEYGLSKLYGHDFVVPPEEIKKAGIEPCSLEEGFEGCDCVILMNSHPKYRDLDLNLLELMNEPGIFFDGWHMFSFEEITQKSKRIIYRSPSDV